MGRLFAFLAVYSQRYDQNALGYDESTLYPCALPFEFINTANSTQPKMPFLQLH
jgi:hypothetical protein